MQALKKIMESHSKAVTLSLSKGELPNCNTTNESKGVHSPPSGGDADLSAEDLSKAEGSLPAETTVKAGGGLSLPKGDPVITNEERVKQSQPTTNNDQPPTIDFPWCLNFLEKRGKELYGQKFKIYEQDHNIIYKLIIYFIGNKPEAEKIGLDLEKGILLTGPVGCGKTTLMNLMRFVPPPERNHIMKSCRDVSFEFIQEGYEVISRYSKMSFNNNHPKIYCFDDLGAEQSLKYYGNECNIMAEILLSRYDQFISQDMLTHITTNLSASDIENAYGSRVRSRMREMFNLISFGLSSDKRS